MALMFPLRRIWVSADTDDHGYNAYDFGWWDAVPGDPDSGRNPNLYSMSDGIVSKIDNSHPDDPDMMAYGNYIIISYPKEVAASIFAHLKKNSCVVKEKDKVAQLQKVAQVGNSGYSFGNHLHLEVCKSLSFSRHNGEDYIRNKDVYINSWYIVDPDTQRDYPIPSLLIEPVEEDITVNQVHVTGTDLRVRKSPEGEIVGYAEEGYYNYTESVEAGGYIWVHVGNYWIAGNTDVSEIIEARFFPVEENQEVDQVEVISDDLRIRIEPSTNSKILGYTPKGFYNVEETSSQSDYIWFKVCGAWIACTDDVIFHAAKGDEKDKRIKELEEQVDSLNAALDISNSELTRYKESMQSIADICNNM